MKTKQAGRTTPVRAKPALGMIAKQRLSRHMGAGSEVATMLGFGFKSLVSKMPVKRR